MTQLYVVQYCDLYGNGDKKTLEVIVKNREDFLKWLDEHNESRDDSEPEKEDEFNLIPLKLYVPDDLEDEYKTYNEAPYGDD